MAWRSAAPRTCAASPTCSTRRPGGTPEFSPPKGGGRGGGGGRGPDAWYPGPGAAAAGLPDAAEGTATDEAVADYRRFDLRARGFRYSGRGASPVPSTVDRSAALRARHHARTTGGKP